MCLSSSQREIEKDECGSKVTGNKNLKEINAHNAK
jgi:hypothetical protein